MGLTHCSVIVSGVREFGDVGHVLLAILPIVQLHNHLNMKSSHCFS